ncbi:ANTAR domain-containing protein [Mycolicibacterium komossense]|uniref:ANTAR domain-containing protein n=1 Tax=Mycolicibacterium komossense TaxID=1779 RepID=A0ABT3C5R9_9MYCO|nr:ANTAR domain-containing protein [Mycolicibacterium komossense]MCV7224813.1 ANTAR domain-containing protein [Mycolicibacterium komossense]
MLESPATTDRSPAGTRVLDAAKGVLVVLRRCTMAEAFAEILAVAARYQIGALAVSKALLELTEGRQTNHAGPPQEAAYRAWANLFELLRIADPAS